MSISFIIIIDLILLLGVAIWLYKKQPDDVNKYYWPALSFKLLAGVAVGMLYFYHYGQGDTITYWLDGKVVSERMFSDPKDVLNFFWDESKVPVLSDGLINDKPRSLFFVKISCVAALLSGGNYWMMAGILSFFSFLGAWYLFIKTSRFFPAAKMAAGISFLFYPSVVFWSSGLIKESFGLGALFFLTGIFLTVVKNQKVKPWEWAIALLSLWIGWNLKYYWIGIFLPISLTTFLVIKIKEWRPAFERFDLAVWSGAFIILLLIATNAHPNFYPNRFLEVIWQSNQEFMNLTAPDNAVHYYNLDPSFSSVLMNSPKALVAGMLRPFVWEPHNWLSFAAGLENLLLLILVLSALPALPRFLQSPDRVITLAVIMYIILLAVFLALSTPNFGTLSRYKIGFLPYLVFLALYKNKFVGKLIRAKE